MIFPAAFVAIAQCETLKNSKKININSGTKHKTKRDKQQDTNKMVSLDVLPFKKNLGCKQIVCNPRLYFTLLYLLFHMKFGSCE
jgi:hypothetical protein